MRHLFYFLAIGPILWELGVMKNPAKVVAFSKNIKRLSKDKVPLNEWNSTQRNFAYLQIIYTLWVIIGLFTWQWYLFLAVLILGLLPKKWKPWVFMDAFITLSILLTIIIRNYN